MLAAHAGTQPEIGATRGFLQLGTHPTLISGYSLKSPYEQFVTVLLCQYSYKQHYSYFHRARSTEAQPGQNFHGSALRFAFALSRCCGSIVRIARNFIALMKKCTVKQTYFQSKVNSIRSTEGSLHAACFVLRIPCSMARLKNVHSIQNHAKRMVAKYSCHESADKGSVDKNIPISREYSTTVY